jgi:hypothetical protein
MGQTAMQLDEGGKYWLLGLNRPDGVAGRRVGVLPVPGLRLHYLCLMSGRSSCATAFSIVNIRIEGEPVLPAASRIKPN